MTNNPNIADLSDNNRPTKLAEKYSELYDNEWTNAYELYENNGLPEVKIIQTLHGILVVTNFFSETLIYCLITWQRFRLEFTVDNSNVFSKDSICH